MLSQKISQITTAFKTTLSSYRNSIAEAGFGAIALGICVLLLLYYPIGAILSEKIDRNTNIELSKTKSNHFQTIEMISYLVNREVNEKIWTPNLPFFFPAAILDNMPNYQLGVINGVSKFASVFEQRLNKQTPNREDSPLYNAASLLRYKGTIWMFSPSNKIKPVPSAGSQYRKARRLLTKYNQMLTNNEITLQKSNDDLIYILRKSAQNLAISSSRLTNAVRENSSNWIDFNADDVFYYNQGKIYAYYLLLKALGNDYEKNIVASEQYQNWISLIKALEETAHIRPLVVCNGEPSSSLVPNHLLYLEVYILKAQALIKKITENLASSAR